MRVQRSTGLQMHTKAVCLFWKCSAFPSLRVYREPVLSAVKANESIHGISSLSSKIIKTNLILISQEQLNLHSNDCNENEEKQPKLTVDRPLRIHIIFAHNYLVPSKPLELQQRDERSTGFQPLFCTFKPWLSKLIIVHFLVLKQFSQFFIFDAQRSCGTY